MKSFFRFIFSHSIFIAFCAVAMCLETYLIFRKFPSFPILFTVFLSTIGSYNFYWLVSKRSFSKNKKDFLKSKDNLAYLILLAISVIGLLILYKSLIELWLPISITALLTLLYCLPLIGSKSLVFLKGNGFIKTFLLAFTWAIVTVAFPLWQEQVTGTKFIFLLLNRFVFVLLLCILFDLRDAKLDKQLSIYSIATDYSMAYVKRLWWFVFTIYVATVIFLFFYTGFNAYMVSHALTSFLLATIYFLAVSKKRGYYFYYFLVDGMMIASFLLSFTVYKIIT